MYGTFGLIGYKKVDRREKMLQVSVNLIQIVELLSRYTKQTSGKSCNNLEVKVEQ